MHESLNRVHDIIDMLGDNLDNVDRVCVYQRNSSAWAKSKHDMYLIRGSVGA